MSHDTPLTLLGGLSVQQFLADYWQKKPLLIRQAFPDFESPVSANELAGMALDPDANVRLVQEKHTQRPWHVSYAPLDQDIFSSLPETHWTFLVTDCEKHWPELRELVEPFRFIPDWRIDDLMISYAAPEGSVGPHIDEYDVFLLQLSGQREWQIHNHATIDEAYIDGIELKILQTFDADRTWLVHPGDLLYLPPRIAHHGIGVDGDCMTASIGFRAPEQAALVQDFVEHQLDLIGDHARYGDPQLKPQTHPAEIREEHLDSLWEMVEQALQKAPNQRRLWLGEFLTQTNEDAAETIDRNELEMELKQGARFRRSSFSRMAYYQSDDQLWLFANGQSFPLPFDCLNDTQALCDHQTLTIKSLQQPAHMRSTLLSMLESGALYWL